MVTTPASKPARDRGLARYRTGDWDGAATAFREAIATSEPTADLHHRLALACFRLRRWDEAAAALRDAVRLDDGASHSPYRLDWLHRLAFVQRLLGDHEGARASYRQAAVRDISLRAWLSGDGPEQPAEALIGLWDVLDGQIGVDAARAVIDASSAGRLGLPDKWWFALHVALFKQDPSLAFAVKDIAAEVARASFEQATVEDIDTLHAAQAFADAGDYEVAEQLAEKAEGEGSDLANGYRFLARAGRPIARPVEADGDEAFARLVRGRSIAVVGAAATEALNGAEIDAFDLVVRTNFHSETVIARNAERIGRRTDICYFNGNFEPRRRDEIIAQVRASPLAFLVLRDAEALDVYAPFVPVRVSRIFNAFYRMNSYAIPKILFDLSAFEPARIKVFNADFFLGEQAHYGGYLDYEIDLATSFMGHDVVRNHRLMAEWMAAGMLEVDTVLDEIVRLPREEILQRVSRRLAATRAKRGAA